MFIKFNQMVTNRKKEKNYKVKNNELKLSGFSYKISNYAGSFTDVKLAIKSVKIKTFIDSGE